MQIAPRITPRPAAHSLLAVRAKHPIVVKARAATPATPARPSEADALQAFQASVPSGLQPCLELLNRAARERSVSPQLVEGALVLLEREHAAPAKDVSGTWRLVFSTATSTRALQYIPVREDFIIDLVKCSCSLDSVLGPLSFSIRGDVAGFDPATGELAFQFMAVDIGLLGRQLLRITPKTKPKTYTFYYIDPANGIAAARSSAGGLALLRK